MSGLFVTFEGVEGAGKTTQIGLLQVWLQSQGYAVKATREPGGTEVGKAIRQLLLQGGELSDRAELLLLAADRSHHVETLVRPSLAQNCLVLCDRFSDSTIAYQHYGRGLALELVHTLNNIATAGLQPDLTLWLDLDVSIGLSRAGKSIDKNTDKNTGKSTVSLDRIERLGIEFHQRVEQGFRELAAIEGDRIVRIDANHTVDQVQAQIQAAVQRHLSFRQSTNHEL